MNEFLGVDEYFFNNKNKILFNYPLYLTCTLFCDTCGTGNYAKVLEMYPSFFGNPLWWQPN